MKNIACISVLLTKHVKYTFLYLKTRQETQQKYIILDSSMLPSQIKVEVILLYLMLHVQYIGELCLGYDSARKSKAKKCDFI